MSRREEIICDLCKCPIIFNRRTFKIKEARKLEPGWENIDAHDECVKWLLRGKQSKIPLTENPDTVDRCLSSLPPNGKASMDED